MTTLELEAAWAKLTGSSVKLTFIQAGAAYHVIGKLLEIANNIALIDAPEGLYIFSMLYVISIFAARQQGEQP